jgi:glycosyltransferase involved in cell wall biosynthesis
MESDERFMKRKVLMVVHHYPPDGSSSGVLRPLKFSKYLPDHGWVPHILTLQEWLYPVKDDSLMSDIPGEAVVHRTFALDSSRHLAIRGRYFSCSAIPDRFASWFPFGVLKGLRVIRSAGIHVLYSTSPSPTAHLIAGALKLTTKVPWVADFRDPWVEEGIFPPPGTLRYRVESTLERLVVQHADRLLVTTPHLGREFIRRYPQCPADKVQVIYNGYDQADFQQLPQARKNDRFEILHAGLVTPEFRNPQPLLRAIASLFAEGLLKHEDVRISFLGGGSYVSSAEFAAMVQQAGLAGVVAVFDRVPHEEALRYQAQAAVLLLLQASDDTRALIPAKAFEYLRLNRPILALVLDGATTELLNGMEACFAVDPADQDKLRHAILTLYRAWQQSPEGQSISRSITRYERKNLTAEFARLLDQMTKRSPFVCHEEFAR